MAVLPLRHFSPLEFRCKCGCGAGMEKMDADLLQMLDEARDLAGIPFYSKDRDESWPLIVAGGPCACNSEPIADFFDVVQLGEGENQLPSICAEIEKDAVVAAPDSLELLVERHFGQTRILIWTLA